LALWGGTECTTNRIGDCYFHQLERNGHADRIQDLDLFASLGLSAMRYPVLWERVAPDGLARADWGWADARLARLRELGIEPIVGLVHHGSGPRHTNLTDHEFAPGLADYARAVATRYPWAASYTPVNEPLTTARFSGLYGHWYPHGRDPLTFAQAMLNQCRAVVLAMRAIRAVNPEAQLVQTEDLGKTHSTPLLAYQAEFENERRWLTFDLLCGRLDRQHPLWGYLRWVGIAEDELDWFRANPCPPDIIGLNHYLTSERFLDENLDRYPAHTHGGNGRHTYADVEAVRVCSAGVAGPRGLLAEAWARYGLPLAVTEVQLDCSREEQLRWFAEVWNAAESLRQAGADVRAVTAWALLGAYDWNTLLTRCDGHYEPGVFDLRAPRPRPTALATMLRQVAAGYEPNHPVLTAPGWWHRGERFSYGFSVAPHPGRDESRPYQAGDGARGQLITPNADSNHHHNDIGRDKSRPHEAGAHSSLLTPHSSLILIVGANGTLGSAFARICVDKALPHYLLTRQQLDIADPQSVAIALDRYRPWAVINAAGYVRVDDAEREQAACMLENAAGAATLAAACAVRGVQLLTFSSDLVFDGRKEQPYVESDNPDPLNVYGRSKVAAEWRVLAAMPDALVVRTSAFFGPWDDYNFVTNALQAVAARRPFIAADDAVVSPTYVPDLVNVCLELLIDAERGVWHLANGGAVTWAELARLAAEMAGFDPGYVEGRPTSALNLAAPRPRYSVLGSERGWLMPALDDALHRYLRECEVGWANSEDRLVSAPLSGYVLPGASALPELAAHDALLATTEPV
jgi:dTDP-4-dehydrorhamnose reductase